MSTMDDKKLFQYFVTIFYVHYTSILDVVNKTSFIKRRSYLLVTRLRHVFQILDSELEAIDLKARECAPLYKKSLTVKTRADPQIQKDISLVIKSSNNRLLEIEVNSESLFELKHKYDNENELRLVIEVFRNSQIISKTFVTEEEITGKVGCKKSIGSGLDQIDVFFEWILDENSCSRHLEDPLLLATHFSSVLLALGNDYWFYFTIPFRVLAKNTDIRVREVIWSSFHEMAFILSKREKLFELLPLFRTYFKEVSVIDKTFFQNCIVFFNDINRSERLEVLSSLKPLLKDKSNLCHKLKTVLQKKLMSTIDEFDVKQIIDSLITFTIDLLITTKGESDLKITLKLFSICAKRLFPKEMKDINDTAIEDIVNNQIQFLNVVIQKLFIVESDENNVFETICRQLVSDGILPDKNYDKISDLMTEDI